MSDICTGIEDRGPHSVDLGENECPRCRITELEAQLSLAERYIPSFDRKMYWQNKRAIGEQE